MSCKTWNNGHLLRYFALCVSVAALGLLIDGDWHPAIAQQSNRAATAAAGGGDLVARGKYIVEDVAMCGTCHTPRFASGELDRSRWLAGAPTPYLPAQPVSDWPINEPRIAGTLPTTNEGMITLLTTARWIDGKPLRDPMPKFHMTRADAEAVVAYLRSLR